MFPNRKFILIDPRKFDTRLHNNKNITLINDFFTNKLAYDFFNNIKNILFICDIRINDSNNHPSDIEVWKDMKKQSKWVKIMKPKYSMLKFRLPWNIKKVKYLDGDIYLPIFGPLTTSETRLIVKNTLKEKIYDCTKYENQLYYFNTVTRKQYYNHNINVNNGLCHCYDCKSEIHILNIYINKYQKNKNNNNNIEITKLSDKISLSITHNNIKNLLEYYKYNKNNIYNNKNIYYKKLIKYINS